MLSDSILRLKAAFATIPMKGLFFWEGLLFFDDAEFKEILEGNFLAAMDSFPQEEQETLAYYQEILEDLRKARKEIAEDHAIRGEVEKIRGSLITEVAHETIVDEMKRNLFKQKAGAKE